MAGALDHLCRVHRHNASTFRRQPVAEISGALGDLGTLLPLMIALARQGSVNLASTLVLSGGFNLATGAAFGIPLPVQPMKAIAAAALASYASRAQTVAAGAWVGAAVLLLSITGLLRWLARVVPVPVVKGIQLGAGLSLVVSAGATLLKPLSWTAGALDNRLWATGAFLALVVTQQRTRLPYALIVFVVGLVLAFEIAPHSELPHLRIWHPRSSMPAFLDPKASSMALGQLPLTTLNSVLAVTALAAELMMPNATFAAPSTTWLGLSVAAMNLSGCFLAAMPVCHGAGGLAAQHRFGARSGASVMILGATKLTLGLAFGDSLIGLLDAFPRGLLGTLVVAAGLELSRVGAVLNDGAADLWEGSFDAGDRRQRALAEGEKGQRWMVMMMTAGGVLAFRNDAVGFAMGLMCYWGYRVGEWMESRGDWWPWVRQDRERRVLLM